MNGISLHQGISATKHSIKPPLIKFYQTCKFLLTEIKKRIIFAPMFLQAQQ